MQMFRMIHSDRGKLRLGAILVTAAAAVGLLVAFIPGPTGASVQQLKPDHQKGTNWSKGGAVDGQVSVRRHRERADGEPLYAAQRPWHGRKHLQLRRHHPID